MTRGAPAVLVVEDNELVRDLCALALRTGGVSAVAVATADDGLVALQQHPTLEVLITDLGLPGELDGRGLLDAARRRAAPLGLVVATGAVGPLDDLGDDVEVLQKPFTIDTLMAAVERARQRAAG